jgi:lysophospholipid acyltransferase (LPLAT)-like uncharacterized protein
VDEGVTKSFEDGIERALVPSPSAYDDRRRPLARMVGLVASWLLSVRHASWRKDVSDMAALDRIEASGERILIAFWHGRYLPLFSLLSGRNACVFASQSFRGEVIAEVCRRFGYDCVLLPHNGGKRSRALMADAVKSHRAAAIAVDGPLGPYHVVKRGAADLASDFGFTIVPVSAASRRKRIDRRRWDRWEQPRLFTSVALAVGEPISVARSLSHRDRLILRERLREALDLVDRRAEARVSSRIDAP